LGMDGPLDDDSFWSEPGPKRDVLRDEPDPESPDADAEDADAAERDEMDEIDASEADESDERDEVVSAASAEARDVGAAVSAGRAGESWVSDEPQRTRKGEEAGRTDRREGCAVHLAAGQGVARGYDDEEVGRRAVARARAEPLLRRLARRPPRIVRHDADHALGVRLVAPRRRDVLRVGVVQVDVDSAAADEGRLRRVPDGERVVVLDEGRVGLGVARKDAEVDVVARGICSAVEREGGSQ